MSHFSTDIALVGTRCVYLDRNMFIPRIFVFHFIINDVTVYFDTGKSVYVERNDVIMFFIKKKT